MLFRSHPWTIVFPGLAVVLVTLGFNLLGDGLREAMDPTLRRRVDEFIPSGMITFSKS